MTSAPPPLDPGFQPQPPMTPQDQRLWATLIHLGGILFSFVPALVGYLVLKDRGQFIREHTLEELNFQISYAMYVLAVLILSIPTLGIASLLYIILGPAALVLMIIAAVKANGGEFFRYPLIFRLVK